MTYFNKKVHGFAMMLMFTGCAAVGPEYKTPEAPKTAQFTELKMVMDLGESRTRSESNPNASPSLQEGALVPSQWWTLFASEKLDALITLGLENNFSLAAADARLREVEENLDGQVGSVLYPAIDGQINSSRQKISGAPFGSPSRTYSIHNASVNATYALDLFGGSHRYLEALESQVDYTRFQLEAARLTVASNIATAVISEASIRAQMDAVSQLISDGEAQLGMVEEQYALGAIPQAVVLQQRSALAETRTAMPGLVQQLTQARHLLKVLVGKMPSENDLPEFTFDDLHQPSTLPLSLPSELLRQRPDILAAEALLHQANANVGVATANLYPRINLSANFGTSSATVGNLFGAGSAVWGLGAGLVQPLFQGGELRSKKRAAEAAHDQALANYRDVVLQAFRDVADTLVALQADKEQLLLANDSEQANADLNALMQQQYDAGAASRLELLSSNQQYQQSKTRSARAVATQLADSAALLHALGGGWWNQESSSETTTGNSSETNPEIQQMNQMPNTAAEK